MRTPPAKAMPGPGEKAKQELVLASKTVQLAQAQFQAALDEGNFDAAKKMQGTLPQLWRDEENAAAQLDAINLRPAQTVRAHSPPTHRRISRNAAISGIAVAILVVFGISAALAARYFGKQREATNIASPPEQVQAISTRELVSQKLSTALSNLTSQYEAVSNGAVSKQLVPQSAVSAASIAVLAREIERSIPFLKLTTDTGADKLLNRVIEEYVSIMMDPRKAAAVARLNQKANDERVFARWLVYREIMREAGADPRVRFSPNTLAGLFTQESRLYAMAVSSANAKGIAQLMDETAAVLGVDDPFDPRQSIFGGGVHFRDEVNGAGTLKGGLMRYNVGGKRYGEFAADPANVLLPDETREFPELVLGFVRIYDIIDPEGRSVPPKPDNGFAKTFAAHRIPSAAALARLPGDSAMPRHQQAIADCTKQSTSFFLAQAK